MVSGPKEGRDLGFGGAFEPVVPRAPVEQISPPRSTGTLIAKPWMIVAGALVAGVLVFGFMKLLSSAGNDIAKHNQQVFGQIDRAKNADAQLTAHTALIAAKTLFAENASYAEVNPASLSLAEPSYHYTSDASTGSKVVSLSASASQLGIAVSAGKTCFYLLDSASGGTTYGSGTGTGTGAGTSTDTDTCTGAIAIRVAKAPAW